jgi:hypothetical protein
MYRYIFTFLIILNLSSCFASSNTLTLSVNGKDLNIELAISKEEKQKGLMFRKTLASNTGMLFVFDPPRYLSFWMKNTYIPLSIAFIDNNNKIINIEDMDPIAKNFKGEIPSYKSVSMAKYALEVNLGWFKKNKIKVGDAISFSSGLISKLTSLKAK